MPCAVGSGDHRDAGPGAAASLPRSSGSRSARATPGARIGSGDAHRHQQVQEVGRLGGLAAPPASTGRSSRARPRRTPAASMPSRRNCELNATVSSVPSNFASTDSCASPTSCAIAESSRPSALIASRIGAVSRLWPTSRTRLTAALQRVARHGEPVRVAARDQLLVVRELALDQPGGDVGGADPERRPRARRGTTSISPSLESRCTSPRPFAADQHLLALREHAHALAGRAPPAGTSRWRRGAARLSSREQHAGEDRPGVVRDAAGHHLAQRLGERGRLDGDAARRAPRAAAGTRPPTACAAWCANRPASIRASSSPSSTVTVSPSSWRTMSANRRAGTTALPSPSPWAGVRDPDRELEVGADQLERSRRQASPGAPTAPAAPRCATPPRAGRWRRPRRGCHARSGTSRSRASSTKSLTVVSSCSVVGPVDCG